MPTPGGATVEFEITARTQKFMSEFNKAAKQWDLTNRRMRKSSQATARAMNQLRTSLLLVAGALGIRNLKEYADTWQTIENLLKTVTKTTDDLARVQERVFQTAQDTRTSFEGTGQLYSRLARSARDLTITEDELFEVTTTVNQAIALSGATAQEARNGIIQFAQGMASSRLAGDELRAVLEQLPRLAIAIADGMGKSLGELRELGKQGALTSEVVIRALESQQDQIRREFKSFIPTIEQTLIQLENAFIKGVGGPLSKVLQPAVKVVSDEIILMTDIIVNQQFAWSAVGGAGVFALNAIVTMLKIVTTLIGGFNISVGILQRGLLSLSAAANKGSPAREIERLNQALSMMASQNQFGAFDESIANVRRDLALLATDEVANLTTEFFALQRGLLQVNKRIEELSKFGGEAQEGALAHALGNARDIENQMGAVRETLEDLGGENFFKRPSDALAEMDQAIVDASVALQDFILTFDFTKPGEQMEAILKKQAELRKMLEGLPDSAPDEESDFSEFGDIQIKAIREQNEILRKTKFAITQELQDIAVTGQAEENAAVLALQEKQIDALVKLERIKFELKGIEKGAEGFREFDEEAQRLIIRLQVWEEHYDELGALRKDFIEGGAAAVGASESLIVQQAQQEAELMAEIWEESAQKQRDIAVAVAESLALTREESALLFVEMAARQAEDEVNAEFDARIAAREAHGELEPEERALIEEQRDQEIFARRLKLAKAFFDARDALEKNSLFKSAAFNAFIAKFTGTAWGKTYESIMGALVEYGKVNEKVGKAIFLFNQGMAFADTLMYTAEAVMNAMRSLPYPANVAAAAATAAMGALQLGAIAATTIAGTSGSVPSVGGAAGIVSAAEDFDEDEDLEDVQRQSAVQIVFNGPVLADSEETKEWITGIVREAVDDRDVLVFSGDSRQAEVIRDGSV